MLTVSSRDAPEPSPQVLLKVTVEKAITQKDAKGKSFTAYNLLVRDGAHGKQHFEVCALRSLDDFTMLHEQLYAALGLDKTFSPPAVPDVSFFESSQHTSLEAYLKVIIARCGQRRLPTLTAFCRPPPYVAWSASVEACSSALPSATPPQCLAMLRAHAGNEALQRLGVGRLLVLARPAGASALDGAAGVTDAAASLRSFFAAETHAALLETGAVEWLCALLRRAQYGTALRRDVWELLAVMVRGRSPAHDDARRLLRRFGALELLTDDLTRHGHDWPLVASVAAVLATLSATSPDPPGVSNTYELRAVQLVCAAMAASGHLAEVQRQGCAALHALACRSAVLAAEVTKADGARLICKAMRTFRNDAAAGLQASACAALAALSDTPSARDQLLHAGAVALVVQTVTEFGSDSDDGALVTVCGFRALLAMLEAGWIAGSARGLSAALAEDRLTDPLGQSVLAAGPVAALWRSCTVHARRPHVQAVCCELLAEVLREDRRRAAARHTPLLSVGAGETPEEAALRSLRHLSSVLDEHSGHAEAARACCLAMCTLFAVCAEPSLAQAAEAPLALPVADARQVVTQLQQMVDASARGARDEALMQICAGAVQQAQRINVRK